MAYGDFTDFTPLLKKKYSENNYQWHESWHATVVSYPSQLCRVKHSISPCFIHDFDLIAMNSSLDRV